MDDLKGIKMKTESKGNFDFENLLVYQLARKVLAMLSKWTARPPRKAASVTDHLDRALDSILLNIAEGTGKDRGSRDRARFYKTALGSAKEAAAALDILTLRSFIRREKAEEARILLRRIVGMLHNMS
ncbi:MAG: four helix bundle protein [Planctomycetota bacterium]